MTSSHRVVLVKLGGSIITDKSIPNTTRPQVISRLIKEIARALPEMGDTKLVLGHGSGSFGHVPASRYRTAEGFVDKQSLMGMAITQDAAAQLNRIVVSECLKQNLPAVSLYASNSLVTDNKTVESYYDQVFREYLRKGLLPVVSGDVIVDQAQGCCIWSADTILPFFARKFQEQHWQVEKLIHVTSTPGVYKSIEHPEKGIFENITRKNITEVQGAMGEVAGFDVTGGMWKKVQETLELADAGIESVILSGQEPDALYRCLTGQTFVGTRVPAGN